VTSTPPATTTGLSALTRPSGAFAMLAVDQREALRNMLAEGAEAPVTDAEVTDFKLAATRALTPYASAVLLDKQFVLDQAIAAHVVADGCALIRRRTNSYPLRTRWSATSASTAPSIRPTMQPTAP